MLAVSIAAFCGFVAGIIATGMLMLWCEVGETKAKLIHDLESENRWYRRQIDARRTVIPEPPLEYTDEPWWKHFHRRIH